MSFRNVSTWFAATVLASAVALGRQRAAADVLPFEALGKQLLAAADAAAQTPPAKDTRLLDRLAPLHARIALGAIELWVPARVLGERSEFEPGPRPTDVAASVSALLALERTWTKRMVPGGVVFDGANAGLDQLVAWAKTLRRVAGPTGDEATQAIEHIAHGLLLTAPTRRSDPLIVILAPTRAQFVALLGAAGVVDTQQRARLWRDEQRVSSGDAFSDSAAIVALSTARSPEKSPLLDQPYDAAACVQWTVHGVSHLFSVRLMPMAPPWWSEGLAICDTIAAAGADETLCTGYSASVTMPAQGEGETGKILLWVTRDVSPFRGAASAHWFDAPLRKARTRTGFTIFDLATDKPALDVGGPFLGDNFVVDAQVANAGTGVKQGFAEFYRAYCAAFVHWLDTDEHADPTLLALLCRELAKFPFQPKSKRSPLYDLAHSATGMTLGSVNDPKIDLEGAFTASLAK